MQSNGRFSKLQLAEIENALGSIERQETKKRRLEAEQLAALASALQRLFGRGRPRLEPADRELAYRSLRLEVATALNDSEHNAERLLSVAYLSRAWERVSVDDAGRVIAVDRYRPSAEMTRLLIARDLHCRATGCRVPAIRCDADHTVDAALGGPTSTTNLAHLCRGHHTVKHHTDWDVAQEPGGVVKWTSPTGREYRDKPPSRVRFRRTSDEPTTRAKRAESGSAATRGTPVSHHDEF